MDNQQLTSAQELVATCHSVHASGLLSGLGGNISTRIKDGFLITPTERSFGNIEVADLVKVRFDGTVEGAGRPSQEWCMHLNCYVMRPDINKVVHVHSLYSIAVSCRKDLDWRQAMPIYVPGYALRINPLPTIPYLPSGSAELVEAVSKTLRTRDSVLLANHGVVCVGSTMEAALNLVEEIEFNGKLYFLLGDNGRTLD
jgi:ribulose-5-phosphate 4-epimerase/fuculose-1-phosphate aldolase